MAERERPTRIVRQLRNGQITIPADFRKQLGIAEANLLQITLEGGELHIRPLRLSEPSQGSQWFKQLYDLFAPVREEARKYSEEEVNELINEAVREVRERNA